MAVCKDNCKESMDKESCEASCDFLERIYKEKPGACPKISNSSTYVSRGYLPLDRAPSRSAQPCATSTETVERRPSAARMGRQPTFFHYPPHSRCSRQCVQPRGRDPRLLPLPLSISIQERKRKRSIIIRWVMQKMSKEQANANANLFVVQWRWGLHTESSSMTEWQTVTVVGGSHVYI